MAKRKLSIYKDDGNNWLKGLLFAQHVEGEGKKLFKEICYRDLEGIVAKRKLGIYKDDGNAWLKVKNRSYSQAEGRHELLTKKVRS